MRGIFIRIPFHCFRAVPHRERGLPDKRPLAHSEGVAKPGLPAQSVGRGPGVRKERPQLPGLHIGSGDNRHRVAFRCRSVCLKPFPAVPQAFAVDWLEPEVVLQVRPPFQLCPKGRRVKIRCRCGVLPFHQKRVTAPVRRHRENGTLPASHHFGEAGAWGCRQCPAQADESLQGSKAAAGREMQDVDGNRMLGHGF